MTKYQITYQIEVGDEVDDQVVRNLANGAQHAIAQHFNDRSKVLLIAIARQETVWKSVGI